VETIMRVLSLIFAAGLLFACAPHSVPPDGVYMVSYGFSKTDGTYASYLSDRDHCLKVTGKPRIRGPGSFEMLTDMHYDGEKFRLCMIDLGYVMHAKGHQNYFTSRDPPRPGSEFALAPVKALQ
jgi:hypothetical protein